MVQNIREHDHAPEVIYETRELAIHIEQDEMQVSDSVVLLMMMMVVVEVVVRTCYANCDNITIESKYDVR